MRLAPLWTYDASVALLSQLTNATQGGEAVSCVALASAKCTKAPFAASVRSERTHETIIEEN